MKKWLSYACLSITTFTLMASSLPAHAEIAAAVKEAQPAKAAQPAAAPAAPTPDAAAAPAAAPAPVAAAPEEDPLKDIVIHKRPDDFASAQKLALQNRDERAAMLQKSIACVQQASTMDELAACQSDERKALDKIRLSYCDTMVSFLNGNQNMPKRQGGARANSGADAQPARQKATECDKALAAVTGKAIPPREIDPPTPSDQTP